MFPGDFSEFSYLLYFVGKLPYEKCRMCVSSQKHSRKTVLEDCAPHKKGFLNMMQQTFTSKKL